MHVRRAGPSDLRLVVALGRRCYTDHFSDIWTRTGLEAYLDSQYEPGAIARDLFDAASARWDLAFDAADAIGFTKTIPDRVVPDASGRRGLELEFYERAGFTRVGQIPFATDVRWIGMWVMCRPLSPR
jgi:hypothetical protein